MTGWLVKHVEEREITSRVKHEIGRNCVGAAEKRVSREYITIGFSLAHINATNIYPHVGRARRSG